MKQANKTCFVMDKSYYCIMGRGNNPRDVLIDRKSSEKVRSSDFKMLKRKLSDRGYDEFIKRISCTQTFCSICNNTFQFCSCDNRQANREEKSFTFLDPDMLNQAFEIKSYFIFDIKIPKGKITIPEGTKLCFDSSSYLDFIQAGREQAAERMTHPTARDEDGINIGAEAYYQRLKIYRGPTDEKHPQIFKFSMYPEMFDSSFLEGFKYFQGRPKLLWINGNATQACLLEDIDFEKSGIGQVIREHIESHPEDFRQLVA